MNHPIYIDKQNDEYSIHCLKEKDLALILAALNERQNRKSFETKTPELQEEQKQITILKKAINNEISFH
jgi:hypothetical protein